MFPLVKRLFGLALAAGVAMGSVGCGRGAQATARGQGGPRQAEEQAAVRWLGQHCERLNRGMPRFWVYQSSAGWVKRMTAFSDDCAFSYRGRSSDAYPFEAEVWGRTEYYQTPYYPSEWQARAVAEDSSYAVLNRGRFPYLFQRQGFQVSFLWDRGAAKWVVRENKTF